LPIVAAHPADAGGLNRLAVDDGGAGLGIAAGAHAELLAQDVRPVSAVGTVTLWETRTDRRGAVAR
jgi:hypothetical protein